MVDFSSHEFLIITESTFLLIAYLKMDACIHP